MKKQLLMTLPLVAALAVPGMAQNSSSKNTSQAPTAQTTPADQNATTNSSTDQVQPAHQPLQYESHEGFWGKINPFARKKYVKRQLDPVRGRVNELDELTAQNAKMIKDVDSRAQEGIRVASAKANEADMHAVDAGNRAQQANQTAQQASTRLNTVEQVVGNIDQYQPVTQTEIRFRPGQGLLSKKAKEALDDMATPLKNQKGYIIEVQGFSPGRGQAAIQNSQLMAQAVVRYLVLEHEIPVYRIYTVGMGNAPAQATNTGERPKPTRGGRVEVSLMKNGVGDLEQQQGTPSQNQTPSQAPSAAPTSSNTQGGTSGTAATAPSDQTNAPASQPGVSQPTK